ISEQVGRSSMRTFIVDALLAKVGISSNVNGLESHRMLPLRRTFMRTAIVPMTVIAGLLIFGAAPLFAQASIAGVVKDPSGGVLPGVTVEAASPALIEKTRSVVTDGTGQYRVVDLRPG